MEKGQEVQHCYSFYQYDLAAQLKICIGQVLVLDELYRI